MFDFVRNVHVETVFCFVFHVVILFSVRSVLKFLYENSVCFCVYEMRWSIFCN